MHRPYGSLGPTEGEIYAGLQADAAHPRPPVYVPSPQEVAAEERRHAEARQERVAGFKAIADPVERLVRTVAACIHIEEQEMDRGWRTTTQVRFGERSEFDVVNEVAPGALDGRELSRARGQTTSREVAQWFAAEATEAKLRTRELDFIPWVRSWPLGRRRPPEGVAVEGWVLTHAYWPDEPRWVHIGTDGRIYYASNVRPPTGARLHVVGLVRMAEALDFECRVSRRP